MRSNKDTMNALDPDLRAFAGHGEKLILCMDSLKTLAKDVASPSG